MLATCNLWPSLSGVVAVLCRTEPMKTREKDGKTKIKRWENSTAELMVMTITHYVSISQYNSEMVEAEKNNLRHE